MASIDETKVNDIIDISIDAIKRTRFRINGNNDSIIELNLSDMGAIQRLDDGLKELKQDMSEIADLSTDDEEFGNKLKAINDKMCATVDKIFDYPVSAVCSKGGTMYDLYDGMFRYEHIIDSLSKLYTNNLNEQFRKFRKRIEKYTDKYTAQPKSSKPSTSTRRKKS